MSKTDLSKDELKQLIKELVSAIDAFEWTYNLQIVDPKILEKCNDVNNPPTKEITLDLIRKPKTIRIIDEGHHKTK